MNKQTNICYMASLTNLKEKNAVTHKRKKKKPNLFSLLEFNTKLTVKKRETIKP